MPKICAVYGCSSNNGDKGNLSFHKFPKNETVRKKWIHVCKRKDPFIVDTAVISSLHFDESAFRSDLKYKLLGIPVPKNQIRIEEGALPTIFLPTSHGKTYIVI